MLQSNQDKSETNESVGSFLNRRKRQITVKRYFQRPTMFGETLFSNTDNRIDNLTALIAKRLSVTNLIYY